MTDTTIFCVEIETGRPLTEKEKQQAARMLAEARACIAYLNSIGADPSVTDYWVQEPYYSDE